jgi:lysine-ketoglutarate reductase/saccharopine dehydrogenase-like protein (TIGR00300 family)
MESLIPSYTPPDFSSPELRDAPLAQTAPAPKDGVVPKNYHGTSNYPEYVHLGAGDWLLAPESRMDSVLVLKGRQLGVVEARRVKQGDAVVIGRTENGEEGIYVHTTGFDPPASEAADKFAFRTRGTRETPFSRSYDELYHVLRHDREHGHIAWVLGPAVAFDKDSRDAMQGLIENGYCHSLLAGNALATHDLEAAYFRTGLGQDIYTQHLKPQGHYNHLDILNEIRRVGSIRQAIKEMQLQDGIIYACEKCQIPYVLAGSIRDDGPLPDTQMDLLQAQADYARLIEGADLVLMLSTMLHSIGVGNMTPAGVKMVCVDINPAVVTKLSDRGSLESIGVVTDVGLFLSLLVNQLNKLTGEYAAQV